MSATSSPGANLDERLRFHDQTWDLAYHHAVGETVGGFLQGLRDRRFLGRRCPECERVLLPARSFCDRCHRETGEWVEVAPAGELTMFTVVYEPFKGMPEPPYAIGYVQLDGADTAILGYVRGLDLSDPGRVPEQLAIGMRLSARFVDEPSGSVTDFWFEQVAEA